MNMIRVLVADDHPLYLEGLVTSLNAESDIDVVARTESSDEALRLAREQLPDIAILDIQMPGGGISAARDISAACPDTKVIILTFSEDEDDVLAAMKAGAAGYALKGLGGRELAGVVRSVHDGVSYVAPGLAFGLLRQRATPPAANPLEKLSAREREVLECVAAGMSNAEAGVRLGLSEKTIKHYMTSILTKLQAHSRVEVALVAYRAGIGVVPAAEGDH
jgi:DNA-binding NarL/FixJ family response regulator